MKTLVFITKFVFVTSLLMCFALMSYAQTQAGVNVSLLQFSSFLTFLFAVATGLLNLYVMNKLGQSREEILTLIRAEFKSEIADLEKRMSTQEQVTFVKTELSLMLKSIELKIDNAADIAKILNNLKDKR